MALQVTARDKAEMVLQLYMLEEVQGTDRTKGKREGKSI